MTLQWGLTGGIGSGKSTVGAMLQKLGAVLIDTDALARSLTTPGGSAMPAIERTFGATMVAPDGSLDRAAMRALAFGNPDAKRQLEAILHPLIGAETKQLAQAAMQANAPVVVFDVPLLTESQGWRHRVQRVLVVDCLESTQMARVSQRPGWTEAMASQVIAQQASRPKRRAVADAVIYNEGLDLPALEQQVQALWLRWTT